MTGNENNATTRSNLWTGDLGHILLYGAVYVGICAALTALVYIVLSSEETSPAHRICGKCSVLESGNDAECVAFLRDEMLERQRNGQKPLWGISEVRH